MSEKHHIQMDFSGLVRSTEQVDDILRRQALSFIDHNLVARNWIIGRNIVEYEQHGRDRAAYGSNLLEKLSEILTSRGRKGFSHRSLDLLRKFYLSYRNISQTVSAKLARRTPLLLSWSVRKGDVISQTVSAKLRERLSLTWSHYVFLTQISDEKERHFYEIEAIKEHWSTRELKRQYDSSLFERLALSRNKRAVRSLANKGHIVTTPTEAVKDPYVLEFLGLEEKPGYSESDLEGAIIGKLQHFLLEMGKGFLFQARQYRITFDEKHFWVDLVFYNRLLRSFVLVDLKIGDLAHADIGQMQMYVNYFDRQVKTEVENPTIGILLCKTKTNALVEMTLPKGNKTIFASRYQLYLPSKADLKKQLEDFNNARPFKKRRRN